MYALEKSVVLFKYRIIYYGLVCAREKGEPPLFSPYGDGDAGKGIVKILVEEIEISS